MIKVIHPLPVYVFVILLLCMKTLSLGSVSLSKDGKLMRCIEKEREALLVFKQRVGIETKHDILRSWKKEEGNCCNWKGIGCDYLTGRVNYLHLSSFTSPISMNLTTDSMGKLLIHLPYLNYLDLSNNLLGLAIPRFIGSLTKSFLHQIRNHSKLQYLNLSSNTFKGPIPKFIGSLNSLRYLDLSNNYFSGVIPHELGNLSKLQHLDLGYNYGLAGDGNLGWLFNLSSLTHLDLSTIYFHHPSTCLSFIFKIPSISVMRLNNCDLVVPSNTLINFSTSISTLALQGNYFDSTIFNWLYHLNVSLVVLDLSYNVLEGRVPESFGHMTALTHLSLGSNFLNGSIPNSFGLMTALTYLDLSANQLNDVLPKPFCNLSNLKVVDFSFNSFTGNLEDLLTGPFSLLQELLLYENKLTGSLPDIALLSHLRKLQVSSNNLDGYLPTVFEHHSDLQFLDLSDNHLTGSLPDFTGFSSLRVIDLSGNEFSGSLPDFTGCSSLQVLRLNNNQLKKWETQSSELPSSLNELDLSVNSICGTISDVHLSNLSSLKYLRASFNSLAFKFSSEWFLHFQLSELSLASCELGPKFPNWIRNQRHLGRLDISDSQISDTIPNWFSNLSTVLYSLNLSSNKFRGEFSFKIVNIQEIDLTSNHFDGPLPQIPAKCFKLELSRNKFTGTLLSLSVVNKDISLRFLDLSYNQLFGALSDNWMHFRGLVFLNLGYNKFSGRIPKSVGHLISLQTLILRDNKFHGELPASLRNCSRLGFVDFGLNKLSGTIPSWIGEDLPQLYALILKSNRFYGSLPYEICHLSNLHFLDLSINQISGIIPTCIDNLAAMIQKGTEVAEHIYSSEDSLVPIPGPQSSVLIEGAGGPTSSYVDNVFARWKGQEFEYGRNFAYLKMIDLSTNEFRGEIPIGITRLLELKGLNLSNNSFSGKVPLQIGQLKVLECLDLSTNKFSGEIPQSMSALNFLAFLNLSNNHFSGRIPSGTQLQGFNISSYEGNSGLCGKPLTKICPGDEQDDDIHPSSIEYGVEGDDREYERWLYVSAALGFSTAFWGFIGILIY